ncbi:MAG: PIG-L deacetylase family protein [Acidimicrobiia bacterium]
MTDLPPEVTPLEVPDRALAIGAHPDDIEFGAGGTLARWAAAGCHVTMLVATDGSKGTWDREVDPARLVSTRKAEQAAAAVALGAGEVIHLDHVDGELEYSMALRAELCAHIRRTRPDVVFSHDPWQRYQLHPDHRVTGWGAVDGIVAARDHLFFPEQALDAHRPAAMLLFATDAPDHWEPIHVAAKIEALLCHSSQGATTMGDAHLGEVERATFASSIADRARTVGAAAGIGPAEAFKRLTP